MDTLRATSCVPLLMLFLGCVGPEDVPSNVRDLRVLGIQLEPPEVMAPSCGRDPAALLPVAFTEVQLTALVADPGGGGRALEYELRACAWPGDRTCEKPEDRVILERGTTVAGELRLSIRPGAATLPARDDEPLLAQVLAQDIYAGLGGVRLPLVLHVTAGAEKIFAQKLLVYGCPFFSEMKPNVNPVLPALFFAGAPWGEGDLPEVRGAQEMRLSVPDFSALEEPYLVPSLDLQPIALRESWKIAWHTDWGRIDPEETGGTDFGGQESKHETRWVPRAVDAEQIASFWVVVRDGRGGTSWIRRRARVRPPP